jgi:Flp pilus assembly protein protease CpaA
VNFTATIEQAVHSPVGNGARRGAWLVAGVTPLFTGLGVAILQPSVQWTSLLWALNGAVLILLLAVASYTDCRWKKIPNWATYSAIVWAVAINLLATFTIGEQIGRGATVGCLTPVGIESSLFGAAACFAAMLVVFQLAGSGAGDVKLAAALGALIGTGPGLMVILWCHITAGIVMVGWLVWRIGPLKVLKTMFLHVGSVLLPSRIPAPSFGEQKLLCRPVPLAAFFAIGTLITLLQGPVL